MEDLDKLKVLNRKGIPQILRKLNVQSSRYTEIRKSILKDEHISHSGLHKTLQVLEENGIIESEYTNGHRFYNITEKGKKLLDLLNRLKEDM